MLVPMRCLLSFLLALPLTATAQAVAPWALEPSETTADLRGVHAVGGGVVWASGAAGTVLRSQDSGFEWQQCAIPPGAEKLDFRAVWAWDDETAIVMSSGPGAQSRLYKTTDGCAHWQLVYTNREPGGFFDALIFLDKRRGFVLGDPTRSGRSVAPIEGGYFAFRIRATDDGGETWAPVVDPEFGPLGKNLLPLSNEAFFAASNSSVAAIDGLMWLGTSHSRVLRLPVSSAPFQAALCGGAIDPQSHSCGIPWLDWTSAQAPMAGGNATNGIFSLAFRNATSGMAVGGDYAKPGVKTGTAAWTGDGGRHWTAAAALPGGYRSAVSWDADHGLWVAAGPNGSDTSRDDGRTWQPLEHAPADTPKGGEWNALSLPWAVGPHGRIGKLNPNALK